MTQNPNGDAKSIKLVSALYEAPMYSAAAVKARDALLSELEAVRLELGNWVQLVNRIHQAARTTALNDGLPARVGELFDATEELASQLTTERARAEEAERRVQEEDTRAVEWMNTADQRQREIAVYGRRITALMAESTTRAQELAAANARVARLEEAARDALRALDSGWAKTAEGALREALSAAPQASTERPRREARPGEIDAYYAEEHAKASTECEAYEPYDRGASPIPQVAQASAEAWLKPASVYYDLGPRPNEPEPVRFGSPSEPQGSPEQAGDRVVMLSELVRALRGPHRYAPESGWSADQALESLAGELERGGK